MKEEYWTKKKDKMPEPGQIILIAQDGGCWDNDPRSIRIEVKQFVHDAEDNTEYPIDPMFEGIVFEKTHKHDYGFQPDDIWTDFKNLCLPESAFQTPFGFKEYIEPWKNK